MSLDLFVWLATIVSFHDISRSPKEKAVKDGCLTWASWNFWGYPLVMTNSLLLKITIEIVDFPMKKILIFHSYVQLPEGILPSDTPKVHGAQCGLLHVTGPCVFVPRMGWCSEETNMIFFGGEGPKTSRTCLDMFATSLKSRPGSEVWFRSPMKKRRSLASSMKQELANAKWCGSTKST